MTYRSFYVSPSYLYWFNFLGLGAEELPSFLSAEMKICGWNGPKSTSIVGPVNSVHRLKQLLTSLRVPVEELEVAEVGFHSCYLAGIETKLSAYLRKVIISLSRYYYHHLEILSHLINLTDFLLSKI